MTSRVFFLLCALLPTAAMNAMPSDIVVKRQTKLENRIEAVRLAGWSFQRKSWEQGVWSQAFFERDELPAMIALAHASLVYASKESVIAALEGAPVDPLMHGESLWRAAALTKEPALRKAADDMLEWTLHKAPRAKDGTIFHTGETHWSDSFHTTPPFLAYAGRFDEALAQIEGHKRRLWNPEKKLIAHRWNEKEARFDQPRAWGGGNGWAAAGLVRVIRYLPADRKADRARLGAFLLELLDGCLAHQRPDGLFHDFVDDPNSFVETNLAQMLAFAIYEGRRQGIVPASYLMAADRMRAAAHAKVDSAGLVQGASGAPLFDRPGVSSEAQAFFLMMEAAASKLEEARR